MGGGKRGMRWGQSEQRRRQRREDRCGYTDKDALFAAHDKFASPRQRRALANMAEMLRKRGMPRLAERVESEQQNQTLFKSDVVRTFALVRAAVLLDDKRLAKKEK